MTELSPSPSAVPAFPRRAGLLPSGAPHRGRERGTSALALWLMDDPPHQLLLVTVKGFFFFVVHYKNANVFQPAARLKPSVSSVLLVPRVSTPSALLAVSLSLRCLAFPLRIDTGA